MSIQEFDNSLYAADGAKITDRIYKNSAGKVTDMSQDLDNVKEMTIVVESEDGTKTQKYMLKDAAEKKILENDKAAAIEAIEAAMVEALKKADKDNDPKLIEDYEAALTDKDTEFSFSGTRTMNGLLYENWFKSIEKETDADELASFLTSALGQCDAIATAYVGALQTAADDAEEQAKFKALANQKAQALLDDIEAKLTDAPISWTAGQSVESRVNAAISNRVTIPGTSDQQKEYTIEVDAPTDVSFDGDHGTKEVTVTVTVTNRYAGVPSTVEPKEITVTFSW